ncbi:putative KinB-signaling pathway activation protein [[Clostridium] ultunense Esp]|nr:putative KinB-signaling pathway activation protein [[Clostridium] ultunense Esp]
MNSRKLVYLIGTTLLWAGVGGGLTGFFLSFAAAVEEKWSSLEWLLGGVGWFGGGLIFGALSLLGYLVFLLIHQMGLGLFRKQELWHLVLYLLVMVSFIDLYLFPSAINQGGEKWSLFLFPPVLLAWAVVVAYLKKRETRPSAFAPSLFFMFTMTVLELIPALRGENLRSLVDMGIPLIIANTWQLLILHRLIGEEKPSPTQAPPPLSQTRRSVQKP